jgi:hypothetical protein
MMKVSKWDYGPRLTDGSLRGDAWHFDDPVQDGQHKTQI